jgi:hypothetical protein
VVDKDLGFLEVTERPKYMKQTYLFISSSKRVEGKRCKNVIVEAIANLERVRLLSFWPPFITGQ